MHGRRIALLIGSGLGMLSVLLPWAHQGSVSMTGIEDTLGITVLAAFFVAAPVVFAGNLREPMSLTTRIMACLAGLAGSLIGFYVLLLTSHDHEVSAGGGLYLLIVAGVVVLGAAGNKGAAPSRGPASHAGPQGGS